MAIAEARTRETDFRSLVPVNRFPLDVQQRLWKACTVQVVGAGQLVFARDVDDGLVHYLLDGEVDLLDKGHLVQRVNRAQRLARRALEGAGPKRFTARAVTAATLMAVPRAELERLSASTRVTESAHEYAISELVTAVEGDWMSRLMSSALFSVLPTDIIQDLFGALEPVDVAAGGIVIRQGDPGDYFYVIESGHCEVMRRAGGGRQEIHVSDLRPGDTFGEAALISGQPRDASVVALTDTRVMRLARAEFDRAIKALLVHPIGVEAAFAAVTAGARWLDVGDPEVYAKAPLRNSRNIPLNALRLQAERLPRDEPYIICCDDPSQSAVGAYILAERGFKVFCLSEPIVVALSRDNGVPRWATPAVAPDNVVSFPAPESAAAASGNIRGHAMDNPNPQVNAISERTDRLYTQEEFESAVRSQHPTPAYTETHTGQTLARLLEDIDARKEALEREAGDGLEDTHGFALDDGAEFIDLAALEATATSKNFHPPGSVLDLNPASQDPVWDIVHDLEHRLRNYVEANLLERTLEVERRYQAKVAKWQQHAQAALRKRDAELKERYAAHYRKKNQALRDNYQKLMALATKISQQKAQLQATRKQMEEKLQAANAVYKQVEDMRRLLGENMGRR